jgi:energy-coupling factor transporter ATP-binding protein EcfA2
LWHGTKKKPLRVREPMQKGKELVWCDAEPVQRDTPTPNGVARPEAEALEREPEAQQKGEEAQQAREEPEEAAHSSEDGAVGAERARKAAEEARQAAEDRLMRGIPPDIRPTAEQIQQFRERHGYDKHGRNIAFAGESGVGKSALLNAIRGLWPDDPGAAAVGVNETTAIVQGYVDLCHPEVKWFDVPGANTPNISGWLYFMDQGLYAFDALVIIISDRFTQTAGTLLRNAHQCGIPTYLVRTKSDQLIQNLKKDRRGRLTDAEARKIFIDNTHNMVQKNLLKLELPTQPVFVVSVLGMRECVTDGDGAKVIDERVILQTLLRESVDQDLSGSLSAASLL